MKSEDHMIIPIHAEKEFENIQPLFMTKTLNKLEIEENFFNIIDVICEKPTANTAVMVKPDSFPSKISNKARIPTHHFYLT